MIRKSIIYLLLFLLIGCTNNSDQLQQHKQNNQADQEVVAINLAPPEIIAYLLQVPWSINKVGSTFYLSERPGMIAKVENGVTTRQKVSLKKRLSTAAEAGFLGLVLAPDFQKSKVAYAYYTYENRTGQFNRIVELTQTSNEEWEETRVLLDKIPSGAVHHGGRLKIGPDGKLYATTGDARARPEIAQNISSLGGKILRLNLDGSIPKDNPFPNSYVFSYGHRNPQGLAWDSDGNLFASEHGPSAHDEINKIEPGKNYGWPTITGTESNAGMESPFFQSGKDTWAPSGMAFYKNKLYVATLRGNAIREFDLETMTTSIVVSGFGRIRDVLIEGDFLYFVSNNTDGRGTPAQDDDKLYRIKLSEEPSES